jgi:hypothetical protein
VCRGRRSRRNRHVVVLRTGDTLPLSRRRTEELERVMRGGTG